MGWVFRWTSRRNSERVDEIGRELSRIPRGSLDAKCLKVVLALSEVESLDRDALKEWSDCIARDSFCQTTIDFCAIPWVRIGEQVGQRDLAVTANTYSYVMVDEGEVDYARLLV